MNDHFARLLSAEMQQVEVLYQEGLQIWWDDLTALRECLQDDKSLQLIPAVVVLAYKQLDLDEKLTMEMASLFKTLYFANLIHHQVKDEEEGQIYDQALQFTILIGDYIFGRILKLLLDIGAVEVLDNLAGMICSINEGMVMQHKLGAAPMDIIKRGNAVIYETAFMTAGRLKALDEDALALYRRLGLEVGMAMELLNAGADLEARPFLEKSLALLKQFNHAYGMNHLVLQKWLQDMVGERPEK
ncbi:MAG TPA: hypothetical protein PLC88_07495 [Syntrophomonas sp.]|nr:hypothetical protein [Syntrophomonas sp.]